MDILEEFIKLELDEGKKLPAALALSTALLSPFAVDNAHKRQEKELSQSSNVVPEKQKDEKTAVSDEKKQQSSDDSSPIKKYKVSNYTRAEMKEFVRQAAESQGIDAAFLDGLISQESRYNQRALSPKKAMGVAQFIQSTANEMGLENPYDAREAIFASAKYIKILLDLNDGDYKLAAASYNAGPSAVQKYNGIPPYKETQEYVVKVFERARNSIFNDGSFEDVATSTTTKTSTVPTRTSTST